MYLLKGYNLEDMAKVLERSIDSIQHRIWGLGLSTVGTRRKASSATGVEGDLYGQADQGATHVRCEY